MRSKMWFLISGVVVASLLCPVNPASAAEPEKITPENVGGVIVNWATRLVNQPGIGDGQCTRLVEGALGATGCKPGRTVGKDYVWGRALKDGERMQKGDIIQFKSFVIKDGGYMATLGRPDHTAIFIEEKDGKVYVVHQNSGRPPTGGTGAKNLPVRIQGYDFAKKVSGSYIVYRPELK